jgi:hypothetical protein
MVHVQIMLYFFIYTHVCDMAMTDNITMQIKQLGGLIACIVQFSIFTTIHTHK